ncbi:MAG TPA: TIGR03936 family radical SAM-associated protein, partial [Candidatus Hungatella pullicola]|nr:TIGR03936 family radical SAM-associated protein [Candidatus Hungatella pullicola]
YFQKAMRRAEIDIRYSEGFSPHQIMSFAAPLGLGLTSNGEYMDIEVNSMADCESLKKALNQVMAEGIQILSCHRLEDTAKNAMSIVAAADYTLTFRDSAVPEDLPGFLNGLLEFYGKDQIRIVKKTKKGEKEMDLKPLIYDLQIRGEAVFLKVSAGSSCNIKPELVMEAYYNSLGQTCPEFAFQIQREEVYALDDQGALVPLSKIGEVCE